MKLVFQLPSHRIDSITITSQVVSPCVLKQPKRTDCCDDIYVEKFRQTSLKLCGGEATSASYKSEYLREFRVSTPRKMEWSSHMYRHKFLVAWIYNIHNAYCTAHDVRLHHHHACFCLFCLFFFPIKEPNWWCPRWSSFVQYYTALVGKFATHVW